MFLLDIKYKKLLTKIIDVLFDHYNSLEGSNIDRQAKFATIKAIKDQLNNTGTSIEIKLVDKKLLYEIVSGFENEDFISDKNLYCELLRELLS